MPKLEAKVIQKELEQGVLRAAYWFYGPETLKWRELLRRIREQVAKKGGTATDFAIQTLSCEDISGAEISDLVLTPSLLGGLSLFIVRDAHLLKEKDFEALRPVFEGAVSSPVRVDGSNDFISVCVFISKDLDARKKTTKLILEKLPVVACEEVREYEREGWIDFLAKRRSMSLQPQERVALRSLDPWSLEQIEQELERLSIERLSLENDLENNGVFSVSAPGETVAKFSADESTKEFVDAFFLRDKQRALACVKKFAPLADEALPLLGLLSWNVRQLVVAISGSEISSAAAAKKSSGNSFLQERISRWARVWNLSEALRLQSDLTQLDWSLKQTPRLPLGAWTQLVLQNI